MAKSCEKKIVVTDLDNTLWPWLEWAVPALDAMTTYIAKRKGMTVNDVLGVLHPVYQQKGTIEYAGVLQDAGIGLSDEEIIEAKRRFSRVRSKGLHLYDGVSETLNQLKEEGATLVAMTDAPLAHATMRLRKLGIEEKFDLLVAVQDPEGNYLPFVEQGILEGKYEPRIKHGVVRETKPYISVEHVLRGFLGMLVSDEDIIIVGDNPKSDMQLAINHRYRGLLAQYGRHPEHKALVERLIGYTQGPVAARNVALSEEKVILPVGCTPISSFREVLRYVAPIRIE